MLLEIIRFFIWLRAIKLNLLEKIAIWMSVNYHKDLLVLMIWAGSITKRMYPWIIFEHNLSKNYPSGPIWMQSIMFENDSDDVMPYIIWLERYTRCSIESLRDWARAAYPGKSKLVLNYLILEKEGAMTTTSTIDLEANRWSMFSTSRNRTEGVVSKELFSEQEIPFGAFPILTDQGYNDSGESAFDLDALIAEAEGLASDDDQ